MRTVAAALLRAGGARRGALVVTATAVASGVLMCAAAIALLWLDDNPGFYGMSMDDGSLNSIVSDPGTRPGVLFGAALMTLPPLLLLDQAVRLGATSRARRDAALRIAGATRSDIRRFSALEVGLPSLLGGVLGVVVFVALRVPLAAGGFLASDAFPFWWQVLVIVLAVGLVGFVVGARSASGDPLATTRRVDADGRLGWQGPAILIAGVALFLYDMKLGYGGVLYEASLFASLALIALGIIGSASWVAYAMARRAERRASTAAQLLAARRVLTAPGSSGRAAAGIGAIGLTLGTSGAFIADIISIGSWSGDSYDEGVIATIMAALLALVVVIGSLVVHAMETLWESRRELSYLAATGTPQRVLDEALLRQVRLVAVPLGTAGAVVGAVGYTLLGQEWGPLQAITVVGIVLTSLAVLFASWAAVRLVRPMARAAAQPTHLRTE